jgi:hypothetical protein
MKNKVTLLFVTLLIITLLTGCGYYYTFDLPSSDSSTRTSRHDTVDASDNSYNDEDIDYDEDTDYDEDIDNDINFDYQESESVIPNQLDDVIGSYNGTIIHAGKNDISIFEDDGWEYDWDKSEDGVFIVEHNAKYKGVYIYLKYNADDFTYEDIKENGFYGYEVSLYGATNLPDMTFNGITLNATDEEILAAYGEPSYSGTSDNVSSYEFVVNDDVMIEFFTADGNTINEVDVRDYTDYQYKY